MITNPYTPLIQFFVRYRSWKFNSRRRSGYCWCVQWRSVWCWSTGRGRYKYNFNFYKSIFSDLGSSWLDLQLIHGVVRWPASYTSGRAAKNVVRPAWGRERQGTLGENRCDRSCINHHRLTLLLVGMLGFLERNETESDDLSLFLIGNMNEHIEHRGFQFHPDDIENTIMRSNRLDRRAY